MYSFRSDAHTGENRCWPCTVTNLVIAAVIAGALSLISPYVAGAFFFVGVLLIAVVGYLVPGTPYLTQRYFPNRVLAWFGKAPPGPSDLDVEGVDAGANFDAEADVDRLVTMDVLTAKDDDSLVLNPAFEAQWTIRMEEIRDDDRDQLETFAAIVDVDADAIHIEQDSEAETFSVTVGDDNVAHWMSRAAFVADIAANDVLAAIDPDWSTLSLLDRHKLSMGLRQFLDACPRCDAQLIEEREPTESCCWSIHAITTRCEECRSRIYIV